MLEVLAHRSFRRHFLLFFLTFFALLSQRVAGQYINGQTFTNGLSIIDSPSPNNPGQAGSSINIAIDVSGDGKLPSAASLPGSGYSTGFRSLEIYLVSAETNINMTVSAGPALLNGEPGSTVKHLNWPIPTCIPAGNYNLTFYESSLFNSEGIFTITPIPIPISNPNSPGAPSPPGQPTPPGPCTDNLNPLQAQPQSSSPLPQSPFAPGSPISASESLSTVTSTPSPSRMVTVITGSPILTLTITLSDGILNLPTVTVTAQPTPTTVVSLSTSIVTETDQGTVTTYTQTSNITTVVTVTAQPTPTTVVLLSTSVVTETEQGIPTTYTQTSTITTVVTPSSQPDNLNNSPGFVPVNAASSFTSSASLCLIFSSAWTLLLYLRVF